MNRHSETMLRDWQADVHANDMRKLVTATRTSTSERYAGLERLAAEGSIVAATILGDINLYGRDGVPIDSNLGLRYLREASANGSVEARYRLSRQLQNSGACNEAKELFESLHELGYAPASFQLGYGHFTGIWGREDWALAMAYFQQARDRGHLWGAYWEEWLRLRELRDRLRTAQDNPRIFEAIGAVGRLARLRIRIWMCKLTYPRSDRLRIW